MLELSVDALTDDPSQIESQLLARLPHAVGMAGNAHARLPSGEGGEDGEGGEGGEGGEDGSALIEGLLLQAELALGGWEAAGRPGSLQPLWPCLPLYAEGVRGGKARNQLEAERAVGGGDGARLGRGLAYRRQPHGVEPDELTNRSSLFDAGATVAVDAIALDALGQTAITAGGGMLCRWALGASTGPGQPTAQPAATPHGRTARISALALDAEGCIALAGFADGGVSCWLLGGDGSESASPPRPAGAMTTLQPSARLGGGGVRALTLCESGVAIGVWSDGQVASWAWAGGRPTGRPLGLISGAEPTSAGTSAAVSATAVAHDGQCTLVLTTLAVSSSVQLWTSSRSGAADALHLAQSYAGLHDAPVDAVALGSGVDGSGSEHGRGWRPNDTTLARQAASVAGGQIHIWKLADGRRLLSLTADAGWVYTALSVRGGCLLSGCANGVLGLHALSLSSGDPPLPLVDAKASAPAWLGGDGTMAEVGGQAVVKEAGAAAAAEAASVLQEQLEMLQRGANADEAERRLQAQKTPALTPAVPSAHPVGSAEVYIQASDRSAGAALASLELLSWGMDTPVGSARSTSDDGDGDYSDDAADYAASSLMMVMTPPMTPLATERSQDEMLPAEAEVVAEEVVVPAVGGDRGAPGRIDSRRAAQVVQRL